MPEPKPQQVADPTVVDAERYTVIAEDDDVRVLRVRYAPHGKSVMHYHPKHVAIPLSSALCQFAFPDGSTQRHQLRAGDAMIAPSGDHLPENLGDEPLEAVIVELKR